MRKIEEVDKAARGSAATLCLLLLLALPASASATTGSIEAITIDPSLTQATAQNLAVAYDGCSMVGNPTCSWNAHAWLVASPDTSCPPNGSWLILFSEHPPGLPPPPPGVDPGLGIREIWSADYSGDGSVQSGPLQLNLEAVNDQYLCLYATNPHDPSVYIPELPGSSSLLASQLLHVDLPPNEATQPSSPMPLPTCKKHRVLRHGKCVKRAHRHHRHHGRGNPPSAVASKHDLSASASAVPSGEPHLEVRASHGYRLDITGYKGRSERERVTLSASRGGPRGTARASYSVSGTVSANRLKASFGHLGSVSLRFRPSGRVRRVHSRCPGLPALSESSLGTFVGQIVFQGEHGYTSLRAHRVKGEVGRPFAFGTRSHGKEICFNPGSGESVEPKSVRLDALDPKSGTLFSAISSPGAGSSSSRQTLFSAITFQRRRRLSIVRSLSRPGGASEFLFDDALSAATLSPPPPFAGTATFARAGDSLTSWTGTLSAPLPGMDPIPLAGPRFDAGLRSE